MTRRIAVIAERLGSTLSPCASIRLSTFFDALRRQPGEFEIRYAIPQELPRFRPDTIVWQRVALPEEQQVEWVASLARQLSARMIYDIDDNLFDLEDAAERTAYASKLKAVHASLQAADQVWCSTAPLARRVSGFARHAPKEMPNALDPGIWGSSASLVQARAAGVFRLLYMGTKTHAADLALLGQAMDLLESRHPGQFKLDVIGIANCYPDRPWMNIFPIPGHVGASYPAFVHWLREQGGQALGVAPLLASPFNECKSSIKVMDYAALGLPALVSDVVAYSTMKHGTECLKVANEPEAWAQAIAGLKQDTALRRQLWEGASARTGHAEFAAAVSLRVQALREGASVQ